MSKNTTKTVFRFSRIFVLARLVGVGVALSSFVFAPGCFNTSNSVSGDKAAFEALNRLDGDNSGNKYFSAFIAVIQGKCVSCHTAGGAAPSNYAVLTSEGDWRSSGKIVPGDPSSSLIYQRATTNMPPGNPLSGDDALAVSNFILSLAGGGTDGGTDGGSTGGTTDGGDDGGDTGLGSCIPVHASTQSFAAFQNVVTTYCKDCHNGSPGDMLSPWAAYTTQDEWICNLNISPGDPDGSIFYQKLRQVSGSGGNMPKLTGAAAPARSLNQDEIDDVRNYILSIDDQSGGGGNPQEFLDALAVLGNPAYNCMGCHATVRGGGIPAFGTFTSSSEFVASGLVVPGQSIDSWLMISLKNNGGPMPQGALPALSAPDLEKLQTWINGIR